MKWLVAGNRNIAKIWAQEQKLKNKEWRFARSSQDLRGLYKDDVVIVRPVYLDGDSHADRNRKREMLHLASYLRTSGIQMSDGAFLERVREEPMIAADCHREIREVVERMHFEHDHHPDETDGVPCRGCDVLVALDKKAEGL